MYAVISGTRFFAENGNLDSTGLGFGYQFLAKLITYHTISNYYYTLGLCS